jgi:hypothetical protein
VDHHNLTAGLDLSFLGLARYLRKRAEALAGAQAGSAESSTSAAPPNSDT